MYVHTYIYIYIFIDLSSVLPLSPFPLNLHALPLLSHLRSSRLAFSHLHHTLSFACLSLANSIYLTQEIRHIYKKFDIYINRSMTYKRYLYV